MKEIQKIIEFYDGLNLQVDQAALGLVVEVEGSSYRRIGARILVNSSGHWVGGISGGCLEGDALLQAKKVMRSEKPKCIIYDTRENDPFQIGVGLGCQGKIAVLFIPLPGKDNPIQVLKSIVDIRKPDHLLHIIEDNNDLEEIDNRATHLWEDLPTLSRILHLEESHLEKLISSTSKEGRSQVFRLTKEGGEEVKILVEYLIPRIRVVIIGDNPDVLPLLNMSKILGWYVTLAGKKSKYSKEVFHMVDRIMAPSEISSIPSDPYTAWILMTHDLNSDAKVIRALSNMERGYVGILGPRSRMQRLAELTDMGDSDFYTDIHSPIGLDIGADYPEQIALSVAAEISAVFSSRNGGHLKDRKHTIHPRDSINIIISKAQQ